MRRFYSCYLTIRCFLRLRYVIAISPILVGLALSVLYFGLLSPVVLAQRNQSDQLGTMKATVNTNFENNEFIVVGTDAKETESVAWGDWDGDGDLDLAVGNEDDVNQVYENEGDGSFALAWESVNDTKATQSVAWGDWDSDGDLDLAVGNSNDVNQVYENQGGTLSTIPVWESTGDIKNSYSVVWGDWDGDGDLDLAIGNWFDLNQVYENEGGTLTLGWESTGDSRGTRSIAWGDWDGDGDLDLAVGNAAWANQVYENDGNTLALAWESTGDTSFTVSVAWGDWDSDGDLDLAVGNWGEVNQVYENQGATLGSAPAWQSSDEKKSISVAWADWDRDGDLDLAVGNLQEVNQVYQNQGGTLALAWESTGDTRYSKSVAWGDSDGDGNLDLAVGNGGGDGGFNQVYNNQGGQDFSLAWQSVGDLKETWSVAWGDWDADGDLDLATGNLNDVNQVYSNQGGTLTLAWQSTGDTKWTSSVAWGDWDGDGDLDLAVGNTMQANQVYENLGHTFTLAWQSANSKATESVAWGDWDSDGDLDLAVGNSGDVNEVYSNEGGILSSTPVWESTGDSKSSRSVAWGDWDGDGDLDLAVGNRGNVNQVYENLGRTLASSPAWESSESSYTKSVAWGDWDGDGDLDLAVGNGHLSNVSVNQVYENIGGTLTSSAVWESTGDDKDSWSVAWGDWDGDGDLDLAVGNWDNQVNQVYKNQGGDLVLAWESTGDGRDTLSVAWGDWDNDGDLDLLAGNDTQVNQVYKNTLQGHQGLPNNEPTLTIASLGSTAKADFYASSEVLRHPTIPVTYTLFDSESDPLGRVEVLYSFDGGDHWRQAVPTADTPTTNLATSPSGVEHVFTWDTFASGFFGHSDNVVLRVVAYPFTTGSTTSTYQYINSTPNSQRALWSTTSFAFRVQGTQVRVYSDTISPGNELMNAYVYRLPAGQTTGAEAIQSSANQPLRTNINGYLEGRGELGLGDQIMALLPITSTNNYDLYHTSAPATVTGLDLFAVTTPGVQELVVSSDNPLMVFDLDLSLEWDARNDSAFLEQLSLDLKRTSQFLYDWTNGQVALGQIRVYHAKENWLDSHILLYASNNLRPRATLGGIVNTPLSDTLATTEVISNAYLPGQVHMAPIWNRFGNIDDELGLDWPRTLAHELGHYLLFMPDNYLGIQNGLLTKVDCQGSAMTDHYRDDYSEFLTPSEWGGDCLNTLAQHTTGRPDWETVTTFYEMFDGSTQNSGPRSLPLNLTEVTFIEPDTPANTLADPFFYLTDKDGVRLELAIGQAQGYLFKTRGTEELTDDIVIAIGVPFAEQIQARGAEAGDRLCVFDYSHTPHRLGCLDPITQGSTNLPLHEVPGWEPQITLNPVTSRTLSITVTQAITSGDLYAQILPAAHPTTTGVITAPVAAMIPIGSDTFTQTITLEYPIANGFVRIWATEQPLREQISEFFLSNGWGPDTGRNGWGPDTGRNGWGPDTGRNGWGPAFHRYGWGVSRTSWQAPVSSRDGQVTIFDLDNILGGNPAYALQSLAEPPNLPPWLTPIGKAIRFLSADEVTDTLNIMFSYLQREVPADREDRLWIAYSANEGQNWQLLPPQLDSYHNLASVQMPGEGIYTLISTIETPLSGPNWNNFPYLAATRPVTEALASIDGYYTLVANYDAFREPAWAFYDPAVDPSFSGLVNDLTHLEREKSYWLYATEHITLYVGSGEASRMSSNNIQLPPATFYGWVTPSASFSPSVGMTVTARIDGNVCGQTTIVELDGQLAYNLQVIAENIAGPPNGCGASGQNIAFEVGDSVIDQQEWDNSQAWFHPLTDIIVPITPTPTPTNTPIATPTTTATNTPTPTN
ncbi:MAG: FG-GAP-like repeat-containing protein, partial [Ardenticatenaceae bacterium]